MAWQIQGAMDFPLVNVPQLYNKRCISAPVLMYDGDGDYLYTFNPTTIFTEDTNRVITSYPSTNPGC